MSYFNTTNLTGGDLLEAIKDADDQNSKIMQFFLKRRSRDWEQTPSDVWILNFETSQTPITSIRRSMTNLTNLGFLEKTDNQQEGVYGKPEHFWKLAPQHIFTIEAIDIL